MDFGCGESYNVSTDEDAQLLPTLHTINVNVQDAVGDMLSDFPPSLSLCSLHVAGRQVLGGLDLHGIQEVPDVYVDGYRDSPMTIVLPTADLDGPIPNHRNIFVTTDTNTNEGGSVAIFSPGAITKVEIQKAIVDVWNVTTVKESIRATEALHAAFGDLEDLASLEINATGPSDYGFPSLRTLHSATIRNVAGISMDWQDVSIGASLELGPSFPPGDWISHPTLPQGIASIEESLVIHDHSGLSFMFDALASVGRNMDIHDNENCTFQFDNLVKLSNLSMSGNPATTLPGGFLRLEEADNIYLNGMIDTKVGSNIFPSLKRVTGSVVVEAWNADFDCSRLANLYQNGVINELRCNGTGIGSANGNISGTLPIEEAADHEGLSVGAWAGIGSAVGLLVVCTLGLTAWLLLRKRRKERERGASLSGSKEAKEQIGIFQLDGTEIQELGGRTIVSEKPDDTRDCPVPVNAVAPNHPPVELEAPAHTSVVLEYPGSGA